MWSASAPPRPHFARDGERLAAVLPTEPVLARRVFLCAYEGDGVATQLARARRRRGRSPDGTLVRDAVTVAALCEVAVEHAALGDLDDPARSSSAVRLTEAPPASKRPRRRPRSCSGRRGAAAAGVAGTAGRDRRRGPTAGAGARPGRPLAVRCRDAVGTGRGGRVGARGRVGLPRTARLRPVEGGFGIPFGGDPEDLLRGLRAFAEQQAESVQEAQREQFATLTLNTAVELTAAALAHRRRRGASTSRRSPSATRCVCSFPRRSPLVSAAAGFMRES